MNVQDYLKSIGISKDGQYSENNSYIIDIETSDEFGVIYSKLENSDDLDIMYDNQVVTEQGSSLIYESQSQPFIVNLIADFEGDRYSLIVTEIVD